MKRGSDAVADSEEPCSFCDSELRAKDARNTIYKDVLEPQAKTRARPEPRVRSVKAHNLSKIVEEGVTSTVPVKSGSAADSSAEVLIDSSVATSVSVEDMVQTSVPIATPVFESNRPVLDIGIAVLQ